MADQARQLRAIVFSDVVDSSLKIFADELIAIQRIKEDLALIRDALQTHGGSLVKSLGDGLLVTFDGPTQALQFIQSAVQSLHARGRQSLSHRFGLHTGEIYADGDDIIGQGVHLASRLQTVSPANGVAFARSTYELIDPRFRQLARSMGAVELKGLPEQVDLYCLSADDLLRFGRAQPNDSSDLDVLLEDTPYAVVRSLSRSARRQTFLLQERQRDRQAVLKLIPADLALEEALRVESACLDRLRHPRIPRVLDAYARDGRFCFIQEYIAGPSLQGSLDLLRRKQRLAELLRQVLQVLEVIHAAGLVHGDIHPANLIPTESGSAPFLVDFSLLRARTDAKRLQQGPQVDGSVSEMGRPYFSAPERARFGRLTPAADLYALGVTALLLFTGGDPTDLYDETQACWRLDGLEPEVVRWLAPLLEDQPGRRLQRASDALQLLDQPSSKAVDGPAPLRQASMPAGEAALLKPELHRRLVITYGPMVDLLLESMPSTIEAHQVAGLRDRLVAAGLAAADVEEAIRLAALTPPSPPEMATAEPSRPVPEATATVAATVTATVSSASSAQRTGLLEALRLQIGPIADLIWSSDLESLLVSDPAAFRARLQAASVPAAAIEALMAQDPTPLDEAPAPAPPVPAAPAPAASVVAIDRLRDQLTQRIGPIGLTVLEQVAGLPEAEQPAAVIAALRSYGVDDRVLEELQGCWAAP